LIIEFDDERGIQAVVQALEAYRSRLRAGIERTRRRLSEFEERSGVTTAGFLSHLASEDLPGGDVEYVEWAGNARLLEGLETELSELDEILGA
jgi:hypothetical protein